MRGRLFIPEEVKRSIRVHLQEAVPRAVEGYVSAHEDEDTLTGHLGANLRTGWHRVVIQDPESQNFREWRWELTYYKFRGRGPGATEKVLGADGLFALDLTIGSRTEQKTLLFQAKTADDAGGRPLLEQSIKLSTWREAAFVLVYSESDFRA